MYIFIWCNDLLYMFPLFESILIWCTFFSPLLTTNLILALQGRPWWRWICIACLVFNFASFHSWPFDSPSCRSRLKHPCKAVKVTGKNLVMLFFFRWDMTATCTSKQTWQVCFDEYLGLVLILRICTNLGCLRKGWVLWIWGRPQKNVVFDSFRFYCCLTILGQHFSLLFLRLSSYIFCWRTNPPHPQLVPLQPGSKALRDPEQDKGGELTSGKFRMWKWLKVQVRYSVLLCKYTHVYIYFCKQI